MPPVLSNLGSLGHLDRLAGTIRLSACGILYIVEAFPLYPRNWSSSIKVHMSSCYLTLFMGFH